MPGLLNKTIQSLASARFDAVAWKRVRQRTELCAEIVSFPVVR